MTLSHAQGPGWEAVPGEAGGMRVRWAESGADGFEGELGCRTQYAAQAEPQAEDTQVSCLVLPHGSSLSRCPQA